jgi:type IV pilus assembly protein PilB
MFSRPIKNPEDFKNAPVAMDIGDIIVYTNRLFDLALELKASDIHIEPNKEFITIRYRESGDFMFIGKIAFDSFAMLLSRIKILANLRIDEKQKPQDGKIGYNSEKYDNEFVDIRVSIVPVVDGEKIVMRILRQDTSLLSIDKLSFSDDNRKKILDVLRGTFGIILVAGPTGSGKSTTLFSMLKHFNPLENNISTLEDPVEYDIPYINQSQVKPQV